MSSPLAFIQDRSVAETPTGQRKEFVFGGVTVYDSTTGRLVFLTGPVDLMRYHEYRFSGRNPRTQRPFNAMGFGLKVIREDGRETRKDLNVISARLKANLLPDLESGAYLTNVYGITAVGEPPTTEYTVERTPLA